MKAFRAVFVKEFLDYLRTPMGYIFLVIFLVVSQWIFFRDFFVQGALSLRALFQMFPLLFVLLLPGLSMRLWAEEHRLGTLELLFTAPIPLPALILGKYLASVAFLGLGLLLTLPLPVTLTFLGPLDWGVVVGQYLGSLLLGGAYLALGSFLSSLTASQLSAFLLTITAAFLTFLLGYGGLVQSFPPEVGRVIYAFSLQNHFDALSRGVLDLRDLFFFVAFIGFFLYANYWSLELRR